MFDPTHGISLDYERFEFPAVSTFHYNLTGTGMRLQRVENDSTVSSARRRGGYRLYRTTSWQKEAAALTVFYLKSQWGRNNIATSDLNVESETSVSSDSSSQMVTGRFDLTDSSVPLGALGAVCAGGAAGCLVVGVDTHSGLHHHQAVVPSVPAVFVCRQRGSG